MDSLTQIVLGAACGEAVAGRRLGNRAMLWGAIGGTIPDLDVFANFFCDQLTATAFHRGFMHSFLFAALAPWGLAKLTEWFYRNNVYRLRGYKAWAMGIWLMFFLAAAAGINFIPVLLGRGPSWVVFLPTLLLGGWFAWKLWRDYWRRDLAMVDAPYRTWVALFFWSIFTHPIIDSFTGYGTQVWQPFSDYRVQWNTVAVVDPLATIPFGIFLLAASLYGRDVRMRAILNWTGIVWFCGYLAYTIWHKSEADRIFEQNLQAQSIRYERFMTSPTIFNNIVWSGLAEGDTAYYYGLYGFNDLEERFQPISVIPKNHQLLDAVPRTERAGYFLRWFSNGYYNVQPLRGDTLQVNDLRFGLLGDSLTGKNYVFPFLLFKNEKGEWDIAHHNRRPGDEEENKRAFGNLWERIKGE